MSEPRSPESSGPPEDYVFDPRGLPITALQIHNSRTYTGVVIPLLIVSNFMVLARIVSRKRSNAGLAMDDHFIVAASILCLVDTVCIFVTISPNLVHSPEFRSWEDLHNIAPLTMIAEVMTSWCVALVKTSIALMLIRIRQESKRWTIFLYAIIVLQVANAVFVMIVQTTRCIPTEAVWNPSILNRWCWTAEAFKWSMTGASIVVILTDIIFSLTPLTFIHKIRRSNRHRIVIAVLMALGLVASSASVVKTISLHRFNESDDYAGHGIKIALWASTEAQIGIVAACIPTLRGAFLRLLARLGIYTEFPSVVTNNARTSSTWRGHEIPAESLRESRESVKYEPPTTSGRREMWGEDTENLGSKPEHRTGHKEEDRVLPVGVPAGPPPPGVIERKTDFEIELSSVKQS
ncbi:hypothetical protein QBC39DRAFT_91565 [Podospora conica]|nr:hypothetical protein QBC39DRAFT_91565 [Schizothecium conicum]